MKMKNNINFVLNIIFLIIIIIQRIFINLSIFCITENAHLWFSVVIVSYKISSFY